MAVKLDGRPLKVDVLANPELDGPGISITGFPSTYLDGATVTAPVRTLAGVDADAAWTVTVGATSIVLSMPAADVADIGDGKFTWVLLISLASGGKPPVIGGALSISRDNKPSASVVSATFSSDPIDVDITIEQTVALSVIDLDGGTSYDDDGQDFDGGSS